MHRAGGIRDAVCPGRFCPVGILDSLCHYLAEDRKVHVVRIDRDGVRVLLEHDLGQQPSLWGSKSGVLGDAVELKNESPMWSGSTPLVPYSIWHLLGLPVSPGERTDVIRDFGVRNRAAPIKAK